MNERLDIGRLSVALFALTTLVGVSERAHAQAWVGPQNSLNLSLGYTFSPATAIVETDGAELAGNSTAHAINLGVEYVTPLKGLAVSAQLPLFITTMDPESLGPGFFRHGPCDDGGTCSGLTDLRFDVRYAILEDPLALAVSAGLSFPTNSYVRTGWAAFGRRLTAGHFGIAIGRTLDPILPNLVLQANYQFSLVQRYSIEDSEGNEIFDTVSDIDQNFSEFGFNVGYFILPQLLVNLAFNGHLQHDGVNYVDIVGEDALQIDGNAHDMLVNEHLLFFGGDVVYNLTDRFGIGGSARVFVGGQNTRNGHLFGLNLNWRVL